MILHHVAQRARAFVITGAPFHAERLRRRDLDMIDVTPVPDRLEDRVRETEHQNVLSGFFPEEMIDPVSLVLGKRRSHDCVQLPRRREIGAERFLHDHSRPAAVARFVQSRVLQIFQDRFELIRRDREIKQSVPARAPLLVDFLKSFRQRLVTIGVVELALVIKERLREPVPNFIAHLLPRELLRRFLLLLPKLVIRLRPSGKSNDGDLRRQFTIRREIVERRNQFPHRQVSRRAEDHDRARLRHRARSESFPERIRLLCFRFGAHGASQI